MIIDRHPFDRATRVQDLLASQIPEERDLGFRELRALLDAKRPEGAHPLEFLCEAAKVAPPLSDPIPLPDTEWNLREKFEGRWKGGLATRRYKGRVLAVHESGSMPGRYYAVMDGHHLSGHGAPWTYPSILGAMAAAMIAADGDWPSVEEGEGE